MTGTDIIAKFNLQVDDSSELSTSEALDLANDIYGDICDDRDWEWLKKTYTGSTSVSVPYIALPADFKYISQNKDNQSVVFVGTAYREYKVIDFASRRDHRDQDGYCYIDMVNQRLYFTKQPTSVESVEYDYIKIQDDLLAGTSPLFRAGFHPIIAYGMAAMFNTLEQTDKTISYQRENKKLYEDLLSSMALEDARIKLSL